VILGPVRSAWLLVTAAALCASRAEARRGQSSSSHVDRQAAAAAFVDPCVDGGAGRGGGAGAACKRRALDGFYRALAATEAGKAPHPARVSWVGDSLTADDQITDEARRRLQARFGDGGPGFIYAVPPHEYYTHRAVRRTSGGTWDVHGISTAVPADHLLGLGGGDATTDDGWVRIAPVSATTAFHRADVFYLAQPHGGGFDVAVDGKRVAEVATKAAAKAPGFAEVALGGAIKRIEVRAGGPVRLFGVALEAASGVVVDNLGVVNATAKSYAKNNALHWQAELAHRAPDLVVVMLGTNEAEWLPSSGKALDEHERVVEGLLATVRAANPDASCLVVSPFDQLDWQRDGAPPRASVPAMVAVQQQAALARGCAFWDAYAWMGGKGASLGWYRDGLMTNDFQHPTPAGARRIADAVVAGLERGYADYRAR
jgi:lysophospholipase L1-like esterase